MNTGSEELKTIITDWEGYKLTRFGVLSPRNGGPWACHVELDGVLIDAIYGLKDQGQAFIAGKQSVREELRKVV